MNIRLSLLCLLMITNSGLAAEPLTLRFIDSITIPTGTQFNDTAFGGISGIDRDKGNLYYAISDVRGGDNSSPRFYQLALDYDAHQFKSATIKKQILLKRPDGFQFPANRKTVDPESIRVNQQGNLYWASEGNYSVFSAKRTNPFIREMTIDGQHIRDLHIPAQFKYVDNETTGGRNNQVIEALTTDSKGAVYFANENALAQDGNVASQTNDSVVRVTKLNPLSGNVLKQYAYVLPKIPMKGIVDFSFLQVNGVTELLNIDANRFITIERAYVAGVGSTIKLVETSITENTTDISGFSSLVGARYTPMTRQELLIMPPKYRGMKTDNIEGITWGKRLANGNRTLILVSDNNFSDKQTTIFLAFEVIESKAPKN